MWSNSDIEDLYINCRNVLLEAANRTVPRIPRGSLKYWWSSELTLLKKQSLASHSIWIECGKPNTGLIFEIKNKDKRIYKLSIKKAQNDQTTDISNE